MGASSESIKQELVVGLLIFSCLSLLIWSGLALRRQARLRSIALEPRGPDEDAGEPVKLLCWIMTVDSREGHFKSQASLETWARRCDKVVLVRNGTKLEEKDGVITIPMREGRSHLWHKVTEAFRFLYKHHLQEYNWFMKADDDTYVVVERLKRFLSRRSSRKPVYYGYRFKPYVHQGYMSGGAGYVLSRQALKQMVEQGFSNNLKECDLADAEEEDVLMGRCLEAVGVEAGDTRDARGRPTFLALSPLALLDPEPMDQDSWYSQYAFYGPAKPGKDCCSDEPISFHYIDPLLMRFIDWLLYDVKRLDQPTVVQPKAKYPPQTHKYNKLIMR